MAATSPRCASTATPAALRSSAIASLTTLAAPSIRRWSHGQIVGGYAQGLGGALYEEFTYSEHGDPLAVTFADYLPPRRCTTRRHRKCCCARTTPTPLNPLGIKGAGESGITGVGAAIASAIDDAIGIPGAVRALPVTPQRLRAILAKCS